MDTLAYFPKSCALNSQEPLDALLASARDHGIRTVADDWSADAAVIWSVLWNGRMQANRSIYEHFRSQGRPVIVIDVGALYRGHTWKVAVNHITAQGYYGHQENLDPNRARQLNVSLANRISYSDEILIAAQHRNSLQVADIGIMEDWIERTIQQVRIYTDRPLVLRPHPRSRLDVSRFKDVRIDEPAKISGTYDSFNFNFDYHAVINYNSGPGIQAAIEGCPVVVDQSSLAHPVSISIDQIDQPPVVDRDQWFLEICHTEYTVQELRKGLWLKRLQKALSTVPA